MTSRAQKLEAVYNFGLMVGQNPWFSFLVGFLAGQIERVHFVRDLKGADIAVSLSARRAIIWPNDPFKATVRGVSMPNTFVLVKSVADDPSPICVDLDFDHREETDWYQTVVLPSVSYIKDPEEAMHNESEDLWNQMDRTLDLYRECRSLLQDDDQRKQELQYYMNLAEGQMRNLSRQMDELNRQMKRITEPDRT